MVNVATLELAPVLDRLSQSATSYDMSRLAKTYALAKSLYGDAVHWTGETVLNHTLGILEVLAPFEPDEDTVIACLLHHVLEQKTMSLIELEDQFGPKVRSMVSGIHLTSHVTLEGRRRSIDDLRLMLLSVSDDIRIVLVSLCDRVHCLKFVHQAEPARAKRLCQDVLQLFAPVAARLGIYSLKHELENGAFPVLYSDDSSRIAEQIQSVHTAQPTVLISAKASLDTFLNDQEITASVDAREKQPFSIFQKMNRKSITHIESVHDLFALRVVVGTQEDCYRVLGLLHQLGRPLPNRFKDYIAFPKPNGYQSLHTTLAGFADLPDTTFIEVQIRTHQMHREALYGIAAHWSYKAHGATQRAMENVQLHSVLIGQESVNKEEDDLSYADHIFVLTPHGDIIELPEGATPLDFAFQVHTDLGLSFRNARVNGSIVSLDYELENGDVVEITKHSIPKPSPQWMQMLKMGSSRGKLRRYLYAQDRPQLVVTGKGLLNAELKKRSLSVLTTDLSVMRKCDGEVLNTEQREDLLMKIGQGSERASSLLSRLDAFEFGETSIAPPPKKQRTDRLQRKDNLIEIEGNLRMPIRYAKCCKPEKAPHVDIVGNISREGGVKVHRNHCRMFENTNPERRVRVWWK